MANDTEERVVKLSDGRTQTFPGKQQMKKEAFEKEGNLFVRFDFCNGQTILYMLPSALYQQFALYGAKQKLGDSAAACKSVDDMYEAVSTIANRLQSENDWNAKRESTGFSGAGVVVRALMEYKSRTREQVQDWIERKLAENESLSRRKLYAQLRATEALKPIITRLEADAGKDDALEGEALLDSE